MTPPGVVDTLVGDYLARLDRAAAGLPPDRRAELLEGIGEHIAAARAAGAADEAAVRTLLDRLGEPAEIVAAAGEDVLSVGWGGSVPGRGGSPPVATRAGTGLELAAVLLMTLGSVLPLIGWVTGVVLLWLSARLRWWEKLLGTLVVPFGPFGLLWLGGLAVRGGSSSTTCNGVPQPADPGAVGIVVEDCVTTGTSGGRFFSPWLVGGLVLAGLVVPIVLYLLARRRAAAEPAHAVSAAPGPWGGLEIGAVLALGLGSFILPFVGPLVGLVLLYSSTRWTAREKLIATLLAVLPLLLVLGGVAALFIGRSS